MQIIGVSVEYKKMVSDGDYGHESAQVAYTADLDDGEDREGVAALLLERARADCLQQLLMSESLNVRRKMKMKPRVCNGCGLPLDDEIRGYLHPECDVRMREERDAARSKNLLEVEANLENLPF